MQAVEMSAVSVAITNKKDVVSVPDHNINKYQGCNYSLHVDCVIFTKVLLNYRYQIWGKRGCYVAWEGLSLCSFSRSSYDVW